MSSQDAASLPPLSSDPFDLRGKVAIVTGAAVGIGFGIVRRLARAGVAVLMVDVDEASLEAAARRAATEGRVATLVADVAQDGAGPAMVARCVSELGGLDILVNNAGVYPRVPMLEMAPAQFDRVYQINLRGLAFASQAAARRMVEHGQGGRIINLSSVDAFHPSMGLAAYDASKGAVTMFTRNLALELAPHRILVNAIAPGGIATEGSSQRPPGATPAQLRELYDAYLRRIPLGRMGIPDDIAQVALFLASPAAAYVTGTTIVVDGGYLLS